MLKRKLNFSKLIARQATEKNVRQIERDKADKNNTAESFARGYLTVEVKRTTKYRFNTLKLKDFWTWIVGKNITRNFRHFAM